MPAFDFVLGGRYRLVAPLGEGGMAAVYRGRDLRLNREVAVKILREDLTRDPEYLARFQREAQFVASLSHPNIVPVYDVGDEKGTQFIVMEYIRGRTLHDALTSGGPIAADRAVEIMESVLAALSYAHGRGLIHRDVKPHNILLTPDGSVRLADFGIAHLTDGSSTRTAAILGSAHYLSPEQSRGEDATVASDIYACGVVLYEMLAGHPPFDGPNALAIAHHHLSSPPPPLPPSVAAPDGLVHALDRALSKNPLDRFESADAFAGELRSAMPDPELTASLPLGGERTERLPPAQSGSRPVPRDLYQPDDGILVLRRSPRKTVASGVILGAVLAGAAQLGTMSYDGRTLPAYPSAPYALVPLAALIMLVLWWLYVRSWSCKMDGNAAVLQWGLVSHHRFGVPVRHMASLELKQNLFDRLMGVGTIELCARDQHGAERHLILQDVAQPRATYDELVRFVGRSLRSGDAPGLVQADADRR